MQIVEYLRTKRDINAVTRTCRRFHDVFNDFLYRQNIRSGSSALFWAAQQGRESTARRIVHLGADIDTLLLQPSSIAIPGLELPRYSTALHVAAWRGHLVIVKLLLEAGANLEARDNQGWTPLFAALASGHEKIARTICWNMGNWAYTCIVDSTKRLTPLHVAARHGLSKAVRYFVDLGTDVDTRDSRGITPLHLVLLGIHRTYRFYTEAKIPSSGDILETVLVLLDLGANPELDFTWTHNGLTRTRTARQIGILNPDERIRELFGGRLINRSIPLSPSQIGRTWMSSSSPTLQYQTISVGLPATRRQRSTLVTNDELFPVLGTPKIPDLHTPPPGSPWSQHNVENLITGFSTTTREDLEIPSTSATPEPADPFPPLTMHTRNIDTAASDMWANLAKSKACPETEHKSVSSTSYENNPTGSKSKKVRGKGRWKPLAF